MAMNETSIMTFEPLSASERAGAIVVAVFALLSTTALGFIILRTIRLASLTFLRPDDSTSRPPEILFFRTQLGHYSGCLILSNLFVSTAGLINFTWVSHSGLRQGFTCTAQAVLRQIGIWGTCWFTATLGVHTLVSFVFHIRPSRWRSLVASIIGWSIALVAALAPLHKSDIYGLIGPSCGVTHSNSNDLFDIFALEALSVILAAFVSIVVYSITFIVLRRKPSANSVQNLCGPNSDQQREAFAEYHRFLCTIIRTMFWFPFAFVLLLLPFCVTRIVVFTGRSIPAASSVFADVCVSMLGFVNVCLLYNTLVVISPVHHGRYSAKLFIDTMKTFGNDAWGESPIVPPLFSQPASIRAHEKSPRTYNPPHAAPGHLRDDSWDSVNSNTRLLSKEEAPYESFRTKVASQALSTIALPPVLITQRLSGDTPLRPITPDLHVSSVTRDPRPELLTQGQRCLSIADTDASRNGRKGLIFKSKAPPALNLSPPPDFPPLAVTNKSSTLAARLGIPTTDASVVPHGSVIRSAQKLDRGHERNFVPSVTEFPWIEINFWDAERANESSLPPSSPSLYSDCDSDHSAELMHDCKVRPLPTLPENDEEQNVDGYHPIPSLRTRSERSTMTTVWSQETGYTLSQPDTTALEMYPQSVVNLLTPSMMLGDEADVGGVMSRPTPSGPRARPSMRRPLKVAPKLSARVSDMLGPGSPNSMGFKIVLAPSDNVV